MVASLAPAKPLPSHSKNFKSLCMHPQIEVIHINISHLPLFSQCEARMALLPKVPSYYILMACTHIPSLLHTHTHRHNALAKPNTHSCHTKTPSKLAPLLPCDYGERVGRRRWPNSHLDDSSEEILGKSWWQKKIKNLSCRLPEMESAGCLPSPE